MYKNLLPNLPAGCREEGETRGSEVPSVIYVGLILGVELRVCMCLCMRCGKFELAGVNVATRECGIL